MTEDDAWLAYGLELGDEHSGDVRADALWTAARQAAAQSDWSSAVALLEEAIAVVPRGRTQTRRSYSRCPSSPSSRSDVTLRRPLSLAEESADAARSRD